MKVTISFKHLEHTEALDYKIEEKTEKLSKIMPPNSEAKWTCYVKNGEHHAELKVLGPRREFFAKGKSDSLYKTIDVIIAKIEKQITKQKDIKKGHLRKIDEEVFLDPEIAWIENSENEGVA